jgi:hypothetical protein
MRLNEVKSSSSVQQAISSNIAQELIQKETLEDQQLELVARLRGPRWLHRLSRMRCSA